MCRSILFTILIASCACSFNSTAHGQSDFGPTFPRALEQAIDSSVEPTSKKVQMAIPERVKPRRIPALQVNPTPQIQPTRQPPEFSNSISNSNVYRAPSRNRASEVSPLQRGSSSREMSSLMSSAMPERFAAAPSASPMQLPAAIEQNRPPRITPIPSMMPARDLSTSSISNLSDDTDVTLMRLPAEDVENDPHLPVGSYILSDQSLGQPKLPTESEFGTVMMFRAGEETQQLDFARYGASDQPSRRDLSQRPTGTKFNFSSAASDAPNPIGFIPPAVSAPPRPSAIANPTPPAALQQQPVTARLGDSPPIEDNRSDQLSPVANKMLTTTVIGPERLSTSSADDFEIVITNESSVAARDVVVEFSVSEDVTVTKLDREAWLDDENRVVAWKVPEIPAGGREVIRYSAICETAGRYRQSIRLGANGAFQGNTYFDTTAVDTAR
ncbi:MAG: hypothetical protein AB8B55_04935 [Mariniblastus sp.]